MRKSPLAWVSPVLFALGIAACAASSSVPDGDDAPPDDPPAAVCGDGTCASSEVGTCTPDCGGNPNNPVCGNGNCETGESNAGCPQDCPPAGPVCGDAQCDMAGGENSTNCPGDCGGSGSIDCNDQNTLLLCFFCISDPSQCALVGVSEADCNTCLGGGFSFCEGMAPDGVCNAGAGEDIDTCPEDCP